MTHSETAKKMHTSKSEKENQKGIDNHKKAAAHFEAAAKSHLEAARQHEAGHHEEAAKYTIEAHGHASAANEAQNEDAKHHIHKIGDNHEAHWGDTAFSFLLIAKVPDYFTIGNKQFILPKRQLILFDAHALNIQVALGSCLNSLLRSNHEMKHFINLDGGVS